MDDYTLPKKTCEEDNGQGGLRGIKEPLVVKIPVVLAEPEIQVNIISIIQLEEPVLEIQRIKKNVYLTQCKLTGMITSKRGKLLVSGFVRKNVEYATVEKKCPEKGTISGDIRYTTFKIPFQCEANVDFENSPILCEDMCAAEVEIPENQIINCNTCSRNIMKEDQCDKKLEQYKEFGEKVFCELEEVRIFEDNQKLNPVSLGSSFSYEQVFQKIEEKMVLYLKIKIFQNQPVNIPDGISDNINDSRKSDVSIHDSDDGYIQNEGWRIVPRSSFRLRNKKNRKRITNSLKKRKMKS